MKTVQACWGSGGNQMLIKGNALRLAAAVALAATAMPATAKVQLDISEMGLFRQRSDGGPLTPVPPNGLIPYEVGDSCYGWVIFYEPINAAVELEEQLVLPGPAPVWDTEEPSDVADDRASARTPLVFDGFNGVAYHSWCVAEGDPEGMYSFVVSQEGETLARFSFRLLRE
jgi:hypothetical protein